MRRAAAMLTAVLILVGCTEAGEVAVETPTPTPATPTPTPEEEPTTPTPTPKDDRSPTPEERPEPTPDPVPEPDDPADIVTLEDDDERVVLEGGTETELRLEGDGTWEVMSLDPDVVELAPIDFFQDPGYQAWVLMPVAPGTATIEGVTAGGEETFELTVEVPEIESE